MGSLSYDTTSGRIRYVLFRLIGGVFKKERGAVELPRVCFCNLYQGPDELTRVSLISLHRAFGGISRRRVRRRGYQPRLWGGSLGG